MKPKMFHLQCSYHKRRPTWHRTLFLLTLVLFIAAISTTAHAKSETAVPTTAITLNPDFLYLPNQGFEQDITATIQSDSKTYVEPVVTWSVDNPDLIEISPVGNSVGVRALGELGTATITATYGDAIATAQIIVGYGLVVDPTAILLTSEGDTQPIQATIYDTTLDRIPLERTPITWEISDPTAVQVLKLGDGGTNVTARALVNVGSAMLTATYKDISIQIPVTIATISEATEVVEADAIQDVTYNFNEDGTIQDINVTLDRTPDTENLQPGNIIIGSAVTADAPPLMVKINTIFVSREQVHITASVASLAETYRDLELHFEYQEIDVAVEDLASKDLTLTSSGGIPGVIRCQTSTHLAEVEITAIEVALQSFPIKPVADISIVDHEVQEIFFGADIDVDFSIAGPTVSITGQTAFTFECRLSLSLLGKLMGLKIGFPIGTTPLTFSVVPFIGIDGEITMDIGHIDITLGAFSYQYGARFGVHYDGNQWSKVSEANEPVMDASLYTIDSGLDLAFTAEWYLHFGAELRIGFAGTHFLGHLRLLSLKAGKMNEIEIPIAAIINSPHPPESNYDNPAWRRLNLTRVELDLGFGGIIGGRFQDILDNIGPDLPHIEFANPILYEAENPIGETPDVTLTPSETAVLPDTPIELDVAVRPFGFGSMVYDRFVNRPVEFWASKDGAPAIHLGTANIDGAGNASITWTPTAGDEGNYEIAALAFDRLTGDFFLPMPILTPSVEILVGEEISRVEWEYDTTGWHLSPFALSPINNNIYTVDNGTLYAINDDGTLNWTRNLGFNGNNTAAPVVGPNGTIYASGMTTYGLQAFDLNGNVLWQYSNADTSRFSIPAYNNGILYTGGGDCRLYALNATTGDLIWQSDTQFDDYWWCIVYPPVIAADGTIYAGVDNKYSDDDGFYAFDPANGDIIWSYSTGDHMTISQPAIADNGTIYIVIDNNLRALNPSNGNTQWVANVTVYSSGVTSPERHAPVIGSDGTIYVFDVVGNLHAVNSSGILQWTNNIGIVDLILNPNTTPILGNNDVIYIGTSQGNNSGAVYALNSSGDVLWSYDTPGIASNSPVLDSNGYLYIGTQGSNGGIVYAFDTDSTSIGDTPWPGYRNGNTNRGAQ